MLCSMNCLQHVCRDDTVASLLRFSQHDCECVKQMVQTTNELNMLVLSAILRKLEVCF